jgi:hypothetical protein
MKPLPPTGHLLLKHSAIRLTHKSQVKSIRVARRTVVGFYRRLEHRDTAPSTCSLRYCIHRATSSSFVPCRRYSLRECALSLAQTRVSCRANAKLCHTCHNNCTSVAACGRARDQGTVLCGRGGCFAPTHRWLKAALWFLVHRQHHLHRSRVQTSHSPCVQCNHNCEQGTDHTLAHVVGRGLFEAQGTRARRA